MRWDETKYKLCRWYEWIRERQRDRKYGYKNIISSHLSNSQLENDDIYSGEIEGTSFDCK